MKKTLEFIRFALVHAKKGTIPSGAVLPLSADKCGSEPWEYLMGTHGHKITKDLIEQKWEKYYSKHGWTRTAYDNTVNAFTGEKATDCQGLLDAFLGVDVNANYNYNYWCTEKGTVEAIDRKFEIGEAVFRQRNDGKMSHVGFICGYKAGEPLVIEAKGIKYGVCVTRFKDGSWTHRGLVTAMLDYSIEEQEGDAEMSERVIFKLEEPMMSGNAVTALQEMLNASGYTDADGAALRADGKLGVKTLYALETFINTHTIKPIEVIDTITLAAHDIKITITKDKIE